MEYPDDMILHEAVSHFVRVNGYGEDGGISARWVRVVLKPFPLAIYMPNFNARRRALPLHDIHHITTGYGTDLLGEAEIAAWEIGGSCRDYWAAWLFNLMAFFFYGWWLVPRRTWRAFVRGRQSRNLYTDGDRGDLRAMSVGQMRMHLGLTGQDARASWGDRLAYACWVLTAVLVDLATGSAIAATALGLHWLMT